MLLLFFIMVIYEWNIVWSWDGFPLQKLTFDVQKLTGKRYDENAKIKWIFMTVEQWLLEEPF